MKPFDIAVIAAYLVLMAGVGFWFMRRNKDADAYFRAGGRLPWWVVLVKGVGPFCICSTIYDWLCVPVAETIAVNPPR